MKYSLILAAAMGLSLTFALPSQARISEREIQQLKDASPEFAHADMDLNNAWRDVYKNSQCPADWKKNLLEAQREWSKSGRDEEAKQYMSQGLDKGVAYTLATEKRAKAIRNMADCGGQSQLQQQVQPEQTTSTKCHGRVFDFEQITEEQDRMLGNLMMTDPIMGKYPPQQTPIWLAPSMFARAFNKIGINYDKSLFKMFNHASREKLLRLRETQILVIALPVMSCIEKGKVDELMKEGYISKETIEVIRQSYITMDGHAPD